MRGDLLPVYETAYNHYVVRRGLSMPYTAQIINSHSVRVQQKPNRPYRPEGMCENSGINWGTLNATTAEVKGSAPASGDATPARSGDIKRLMDESATTPEGCTIEKFRVVSPCMGREIKAIVVLPPEYQEHPEKKYPVLHTLHGAKSPIDRYLTMTPVLLQSLRDKPMIVTCMDVDGFSWYLDSPYPQAIARGNDSTKVKSLFTTFFFDEFIPCLDQHYRINPRQRMLTGNSMGGFGAFHYMLTKPEQFLSVSSLSGLFEKTDADQAERKWEPLLGSIQEFPDRHRSVDVSNT